MRILTLSLFFLVSCSDGGGLIGTPIDTTTQTKPDKLPVEPSQDPKGKPLFAFTYGYLEPVKGLTAEGDNWEVLQNLIDNAEGRIILPAGTYFLSKPLTWTNKTVVIEGQGVGLTILQFRGDALKISRTHSQARSKISGLSILGNGTGEGLLISAITDLQDIYVKGFGGDGIRYTGNLQSNGTDVSGSVVINAEAVECGGNGFTTEGDDANAISFYGCNARDNKGVGFQDNSLLGCSYFSPMAHYNAKGDFGVRNNNNSRTVIAGAYSEGGSPLSQIALYTTVYGGTWGTGFKINTNGEERHGNYLPLEGNQ